MRAMKYFVAAWVAVLLLSACGPQPSGGVKFQNTDVTGADFGKGFALTDHTGKPRTLADFKGKLVVMFFGYTQCPDVCPTTLAEMAKVIKELGPDGDKVQVLFVTIDPERDTKDLLKQYVTAFHPASSAWPATWKPPCARPRNSRFTCKSSSPKHLAAATAWITRRGRSSSTGKAGCACS